LYIDNIDLVKQKIENLTRMGIEPRINLDINFVKVEENKYSIIIKIPKSWTSPHRVIFKPYSKTKDQFYSRNSSGKYPLDLGELRSVFSFSDKLTEQIENFKAKRVAKIIQEDTPLILNKGGKIILHIIPAEAFKPAQNFNIKNIIDQPTKMSPIYSRGWSHRINLEGFLTFSGEKQEGRFDSYTQLYRNGIIEAVEACILSNKNSEGDKKIIPSITYEEELIKSLKEYLLLLKEIGVLPPFFIFLTLIGVQNFEMGVDSLPFWRDYYKIDRDILNLPEAFIDNHEETAEKILKPMFDLIWNSCGYKESQNFDKDGNWKIN